MGIRNPKRSRGKKSRGVRREEIAKKLGQLRGNLKRRYNSGGHTLIPVPRWTTNAADATADVDHGRHDNLAQEHDTPKQQFANLVPQAAATLTQRER